MFHLKHRARLVLITTCSLLISTAGCLDVLENDSTSVGSEPLVFVLPESGAEVQQPITIGATGTGITSVSVVLDGETISTDNESPYEWILDPAQFTAGSHELELVAVQNGTRRNVTVNLTLVSESGEEPGEEEEEEEEPTGSGEVEFIVPADGASIQASVVLTVQGAGVTSVRFLLDGSEVANDSSAPFQWTLDPAQVSAGSHALRIEANYNGGTDVHTSSITTIEPSDEPAPPSEVLTAIQNLQPGQWYEIKNTPMDAVAPSPQPQGSFRAIIGAWSGGAFDTKRSQLLVWGGGHGDYSGNEIYGFSMKNFRWTRLTEPSSFGGDPGNGSRRQAHADGGPMSRHTYDMIEYIPQVDRFVAGGGAVLWQDGQFEDQRTRSFNFDTKRWSDVAPAPCASIAAVSAVGPDGRMWMHGSWGSAAKLAAFDPTTNEWSIHVEWDPGWFGYGRNAEIDPNTNKFYAIGSGGITVWDLAKPNEEGQRVSTSGSNDIESRSYPGVAYHPGTKRIVAWSGGSTVYALNAATMTWTSRSTSGVNTSAPSAPGNGTNGRWRYCPDLDVFVVVNATSGNVFVYKHG